jgi:hypothetical protein
MAKFKFDMANVKRFLFVKGEKIALVACTAITVLIVVTSLYSGFTSRGADSGKPWDVAIEEKRKAMDQAILSARLNEAEVPPPPDIHQSQWKFVVSPFPWAPPMVLPDKALYKRVNPYVLSPLPEGEKHWQMNYYPSLYYGYTIDTKSKKVEILEGGGKGGGMAGMPNAAMPAAMPAAGTKGAASGAAGAGQHLAKSVFATRMAVISGVFPMREQLDEFRKALRYATIEELLAHRADLPKPLGLEVSRCEIMRDGKPKMKKAANGKDEVEWTPLFSMGNNGKVTVAPSIKRMMRHMLIDEDDPQELANFIFPGLVTPLPQLANSKYAKLDLKGIEVKEKEAADKVAAMPGVPKAFGSGIAMPSKNKPGEVQMSNAGGAGGGAAGADAQTREEPWKKLSQDLQDKFNEIYFMFDPFGRPQGAEKKQAATGPAAGIGSAAMPMGNKDMTGGGGGATTLGWDAVLGGGAAGMFGGKDPMGVPMSDTQPDAEAPKTGPTQVVLADALIRFFDPDVQPGKTYRYSVRVRMANPNHEKEKEVAYKALAAVKELDFLPNGMLGWSITPEISIPVDYAWYAVDQTPEMNIKNGAHFTPVPTSRTDVTPIQVHRWIDRVSASPMEIGDWAIAERIYTRRGEPIGKPDIMVEVPLWNKSQQTFLIGDVAVALGKAKLKKAPAKATKELIISGLQVDLTTAPPAILIDFEGGRKTNDSAAADVLVLTPEGKLVVRNSRADAETETAGGGERRERFEQWRDRNKEIRHGNAGGAAPAMPGPNPMMPKNNANR